MFQLKHRLVKLKIIQPDERSDIGEDSLANEEVEVDQNGVCDGKPDTGNQASHAHFNCKQTHNEELCVASCGVILGRATFYGSEEPNGVRVSCHWSTSFTSNMYLDIPNAPISDKIFTSWCDLARQ